MQAVISITRVTSILFISALAALACFGLLLGLAWLPAFAGQVSYKTISAIVSAAAAFTAGGFVAGSLGRRARVWYGLAFGLLLGLFSVGYISGLHPVLLVTTPLAGLLGGLGAVLAERLLP